MNDQLPLAGATPAQQERAHALVDILYLMQVVWLYVFAAVYPFVGLAYGIILTAGSLSPKAKRIGRVTLILGIINLGLCLVAGAGIVVLSLTGVLAGIAAAD